MSLGTANPQLPDHVDAQSAEELLPLVHRELRRLASVLMARENPGQTLQPTALVHEAWLKLTRHSDKDFQNRTHFFRTAAQAMRQILVDRARQRRSEKHGGNLKRTSFPDSKAALPVPDENLIAIHEALEKFEAADPLAADLVKLRFFAGMSLLEAAAVLDISQRAAERLWTFARAWLRKEIER